LFDFGQGYWPVQGGICDFTFYTHNSNAVTGFFPSIHAHSVHSFSSLSYDRSKASCPHSAI